MSGREATGSGGDPGVPRFNAGPRSAFGTRMRSAWRMHTIARRMESGTVVMTQT